MSDKSDDLSSKKDEINDQDDEGMEFSSAQIGENDPKPITGTVSAVYTMNSGMSFEFKRNSGITKYVYPWPMEGQRVPYPDSWRKYTDDSKTRENPFAYGFGLWWISFVVFGADRRTLQVPKEKYEELVEVTGWDLDLLLQEDDKPNNEGPNRVWLTDYIHDQNYPEELLNRVNIQTLPELFKVNKVLGWLYEKKLKALPMFVLVMYSMLIPILWAWILYGLIPLGNFGECGFKSFAVYIFVTNPLTEVVWSFVDLTLMFASLDPKLPWRPFWMYFPLLAVIYFAQVCLYSAVNLTVGSFTCQGLVARAVTTGISYFYYWLLQDKMYGFEMTPPLFRGLTWRHVIDAFTKKCTVTPEQHENWKNWLKISFWRSILYYGYAAYTIGIKLAPSGVQTALPILLAIFNIAFRKIVQHLAVPYHRDVNFLLAGLTLYSMNNTFIAFSTADINLGEGGYETNWRTYLTMFSVPLAYIFKIFLHQSELWFRFRNWIKKIPKPIFTCQPFHSKAFGIEEDMDFDSRGTQNDHPGYRRTKFYFDFLSIWGGLSGYMSYLFVSWLLVIGPNKENYPYNETFSVSDAPFTTQDWYFSLIYCAAVSIMLFITIMGMLRFFRQRFENVYPFAKSVQRLWSKYPYKLGYASLIFSAVLADAISMYMSFNRVWFADIGDTMGSCRRT